MKNTWEYKSSQRISTHGAPSETAWAEPHGHERNIGSQSAAKLGDIGRGVGHVQLPEIDHYNIRLDRASLLPANDTPLNNLAKTFQHHAFPAAEDSSLEDKSKGIASKDRKLHTVADE